MINRRRLFFYGQLPLFSAAFFFFVCIAFIWLLLNAYEENKIAEAKLKRKLHDEAQRSDSPSYKRQLKKATQISSYPSEETTIKLIADNSLRDQPGYREVLERRLDERRRKASDACHKYFGFRPSKYRSLAPYRQRRSYSSLLVSDEHQIIFCSIPKVASTKFKKLLILTSRATNFTSLEQIPDSAVIGVNRSGGLAWSHFRPLSDFTEEEVELRLGSFKKIMFVRNPYERVLDAWMSRFKFGVNISEDSTFKLDMVPLNDNGDRKTWDELIKQPLQRILNKMPEFLSFEQFINYLGKTDLTAQSQIWFSHYYNHCFSCIMEYNYIGHLEDLDEVEHVFRNVTRFKGRKFPFSQDPNVEARSLVYKQLLSRIPISGLEAFHRKYYIDRVMFGLP